MEVDTSSYVPKQNQRAKNRTARPFFLILSLTTAFTLLAGSPASAEPKRQILPATVPALFLHLLRSEQADRLGIARKVRKNANHTLASQPEDIVAKKMKAVAFGVLGKRAERSEALKEKFATNSRKLLNELGESAPDDPWIKLLDGLWHLEVSRRGGMMAGFLLGASTRKGNEILNATMTHAPHPLIAYLHATSLYAYGDSLSHQEARVALDAGKVLLTDDSASELKDLYGQLETIIEQNDPKSLTDFAQTQ